MANAKVLAHGRHGGDSALVTSQPLRLSVPHSPPAQVTLLAASWRTANYRAAPSLLTSSENTDEKYETIIPVDSFMPSYKCGFRPPRKELELLKNFHPSESSVVKGVGEGEVFPRGKEGT